MAILDLGISREIFFDKYFEKRIFHREAALSECKIALSDIEQALYAWDPVDPNIRLFAKGPVPQREYLEPCQDIEGSKTRIVPDKIKGLLTGGATLVLDRIERKIPALGAICQQVAQLTGQGVGANAYIAFGGDGTFGKHWDTHDVLAIQLIGRKRWRVYGPTYPLPLRGQTSAGCKTDCPRTPVFDSELSAGDALYLPRGWWHEASPFPNEKTVHISVGIHTLKAIDYLLWFSETVMPEFLAARVTLQSEERALCTTRHLLEVLCDQLTRQEHIDRFFRSECIQAPALVDSFLPAELR